MGDEFGTWGESYYEPQSDWSSSWGDFYDQGTTGIPMGGGFWEDAWTPEQDYYLPSYQGTPDFSTPWGAPDLEARSQISNMFAGPGATYQPGAISNPWPGEVVAGNPSGPSLGEDFLRGAGGNPYAAHSAAMYYRGFPGFENNPNLRDAEHYLTTETMMRNPALMTSGVAPVAGLTLPALYAGAKAGAQLLPPWLGQYLPYLYNASPPSWGEVWSGMAPVFKAR